MNKMKNVLLGAVAALSFSACTSITPMEQTYSGFLSDYSKLQKIDTTDGQIMMRWVDPQFKHDTFKAAIIDPVAFYPEPKYETPEQKQRWEKISAYLTEQLRAEVSAKMPVTTTPGPGVVRLRTAITGVATPMEGLKFYEVTPITLVYAGATAATGSRDRVVVIYLEGESIDTETNKVVMQGVRQGTAESLRDENDQLDVKKVKKLLDTWAHTAIVTMQSLGKK